MIQWHWIIIAALAIDGIFSINMIRMLMQNDKEDQLNIFKMFLLLILLMISNPLDLMLSAVDFAIGGVTGMELLTKAAIDEELDIQEADISEEAKKKIEEILRAELEGGKNENQDN